MTAPDEAYDQDGYDTHYEIDLDPEEDEPAQHQQVYVDATVREHTEVPIIPAGWRGWSNIKATVRHGLVYYGHILAVHLARLIPIYLPRMLFWAAVGAGKLTWRFLRWVGDPDGRPALDEAARRDSPDAFRHLREQHDAHVKHRLVGLATGLLVLAVAVLLLWWLAPWWVHALVAAVALPTLAKVGKPAHRHIITPAVVTPRVRRLNADIVLRAYYAAGLGHPDKPGQQVMFGSPMARDGDGSAAAVDLPYGRGFTDALNKREAIASGLDVTISQVFLTRDPSSNRRHRLWVADKDPLSIPAGRTPLLRLQPVDIWRPIPFGLDERGRKVEVDLMWHSLLVGAVPRAGKTFSARTIALAAAMDPYVKLTVFDGKGSPDWRHFSLVADRHGLGLAMTRDGDPVDILLDTLREIKDEVQGRYQRLRELPVERCPEGKLTRALARDPAAGMPVQLVVIDEVQEYFDLDDRSKEIASLLVYLVKVAPGAGVIVMSATQRPSGIGGTGATSTAFTSFRDNHQIRFALRTSSWQVSDLVLGAGAYSEGHDSSALLPTYKGVGILRGATDDTPVVRTYLADGADAERILTAARRLRHAAGTLSGMAAGDDITREVRDPLADVIRVWAYVDRPALHWSKLAELLARQLPDRYGREDAESVSALLRSLGVPSVDVKAGGQVLKGCRREAVEAVHARRQVGSGSGALVPVTYPEG
ncbi:MAG: cell division protein FtsK [Natronosporangium sp.]